MIEKEEVVVEGGVDGEALKAEVVGEVVMGRDVYLRPLVDERVDMVSEMEMKELLRLMPASSQTNKKPVALVIDKISRNGNLTILFNQKLRVPEFIDRNKSEDS